MGQTTDDVKKNDIIKHIEVKRSDLAESLNQLETRVKTVTDWRYQIREHPQKALAVAFGAGLLFSFTR